MQHRALSMLASARKEDQGALHRGESTRASLVSIYARPTLNSSGTSLET